MTKTPVKVCSTHAKCVGSVPQPEGEVFYYADGSKDGGRRAFLVREGTRMWFEIE